MTLALDLAFDQERLEQHSRIASSLYLDGITDGYHKNPCNSPDYEYLLGYIEGQHQHIDELKQEIEKLLGNEKALALDDCPF